MLRKLKACDVTGTTKDVHTYKINIVDVDGEAVTYEFSVDLCPRAMRRLVRFIGRGLRAPTPRDTSPKLDLMA